MEKTSTLINIARGAVVDTAALTARLKQEQIYAAGINVTDPDRYPVIILFCVWKILSLHHFRQREDSDPTKNGRTLICKYFRKAGGTTVVTSDRLGGLSLAFWPTSWSDASGWLSPENYSCTQGMRRTP